MEKIMDTRELEKYLKFINKKFPTKVKKVVKRYENNIAFEVKKEMPNAFKKTMIIKKKRAITTMNKAVMVQKSTGNGATVGSLVYNKNRKNYGRYMLQRMFFGERLKQAGNSGKFRTNLYIGSKKLSLKMIRNSVRLPKKITTKNKRQRIAIGASIAKKRGKKILFTNDSILKVNKKTTKKIINIRKSGSIKTKKIDWMTPATTQSLRKKEMLFIKAMNFELSKK